MKLPRLAIDNYQFTLVIFILLTIAGISSFLRMPRSENPVVYIPGGGVVVIYPGAGPPDMEQLIAAPIEEAINELEDIKKINTTVTDGIASINVEFEYSTDADRKYDEVVRQVNSVRGKLPRDIFDLFIWKFSSSDVAIMQLALVGENAEYNDLEMYADRLKRLLEKVKGVRKVEIHACPKQELRISVDMEKMAGMNISLDHVINAVNSNNANIPGGNLDISGKSFSIKTSGSYSGPEQIRNTVVNSFQGRLVYIRDIADVGFEYEDNIYFGRFNGKKAVYITVQQKDGLNIFEITKNIMPELGKFRKELDRDVTLETIFDQSVIVDDRISNFLKNLAQGILLVGLVVLFALGFRSSVIVIIAIPLSIVIGLWFVDLYGLGIQQITIAGLVVALGLLVDNSIVIIENINRFRQMGHSPRDAAIMGTAQIGWPVVSSTVTTLLAFIPIIMMPDKAGDFIRGLPVTIMATLTVSLLIALTLSPMIARLLFRKKIQAASGITGISQKKGFQRSLQKFIEGPYGRLLAYSLRHRFPVVAFSLVALAGAGVLFCYGVKISFFPTSETPQFLVRINLPQGSGLTATNDAARFAESVLDTMPEVRHYATNVGHGNPRVYYNVFAKNYSRNYADIYVQLKEYEYNEFNETIRKLRKIFKEFTGAKFSVQIFEQGVPIDAPVMIYIDGENVDTLKSIAGNVEKYLEQATGAINVENLLTMNKTDLQVTINRDKAGMLGIPVHEIDKTVRAAINGLTISSFRDSNGDEYNIVVRLPYEGKITIKDFERVYVTSLAGKQIPLLQVASAGFSDSPGIIKRRNMSRTALLTADVLQGYSVDEVLAPVIEKLDKYPFPTGYTYYIAGEPEARGETFGGMGVALMIAVIAVFAVLVLQFRSFLQPLIIFISFLLAFIGVALALYLTGNPFSFTAFIGFISLAGIVVNNAIILIDYTNRLRKEGKTITDALLEAGQTRFTPIILTTLTTIGGLLPLTLQGGDMWAPLGWTIIGGLLVSTVLTLVVVPVIYSQIETMNQRSDDFSKHKIIYAS